MILEISHPLSHIFNLSLSTGTFPSMLKTSRTVLTSRRAHHCSVTIIDPSHYQVPSLNYWKKLSAGSWWPILKIMTSSMHINMVSNTISLRNTISYLQLTNFTNNALNKTKNTQLASFQILKKLSTFVLIASSYANYKNLASETQHSNGSLVTCMVSSKKQTLIVISFPHAHLTSLFSKVAFQDLFYFSVTSTINISTHLCSLACLQTTLPVRILTLISTLSYLGQILN